MKLRDDEADARMARAGGVLAYLPWILRYPLSGFCGPVVLMITLFITLAMKSTMILPAGIPDTGLPLLMITLIWTIYYLMRVIQHTARGYATPPPMTGEVIYLTGGFKPVLLPALAATAYLALRSAYPARAQALLAAAAFVMPAYLFVLATEENLLQALNPLRWLQLIAVTGLAYLLPGLLFSAGVAGLLWVSSSAGITLLVAGLCYLLFMTAHLLGYLGFRRHRQLGLHIEVRHPDEVAREREQADRLASLLVRIENCLQNKDEPGAAREIEAEPGGPVNVRGFFEDLFQSMQARGTTYVQHSAGRRLIAVLLREHRAERALEVAETCLNKNMHFEPQDSAQLETLARQALDGRYYGLFERLLRDIEQRYPGQAIVVSAQFMRAQYQAEHRNDEAAALALLQPLLAHTGHPQHARIAAYARAMDNLVRQKRG